MLVWYFRAHDLYSQLMSIFEYYEKIWEREINELKTVAILYKHKKTNTEVLVLQNDDNNKSFGISFRTIPESSNGVAHILEHSVLNGSKKYPVKEPFVELLKTSVQTFLNAWTFPDKTVYPVASQNDQDFFNLMDVYLDACFFPLLKEEVFLQEGWHYELNDKDELNIKGVVYNEMKGARSTPDGLLEEYVKSSLYPKSTYSYDSGGDPQFIRSLTYDNFLDFHIKHYHPSNAKVCFYGNVKLEKAFSVLHDYLDQFDSARFDTHVSMSQGLPSQRNIEQTYPVGSTNTTNQYITACNWLLKDLKSPEDRLGFEILSYWLHHSNTSPLKKALIDSGLGEDLTRITYDREYLYPIFSIGVKGAKKANLSKIETVITNILTDLSDVVNKDMILAAINRVEFYRRESEFDEPKGVQYFRQTLESWNYDKDPLEPLLFEDSFKSIRNKLENNEKYFEGLIKQYILENQHATRVHLIPDPEYINKKSEEETKYLKETRMSLTQDRLDMIKQTLTNLQKWQSKLDDPEALKTIPRLKIQDISKEIRQVPTEKIVLEKIDALIHPINTQGIVYLDLGIDLSGLETNLIQYLPVFGRALTKLGTTHKSHETIALLLDTHTGGMSSQVYSTVNVLDKNSCISKFMVSTKTLGSNVEKTLDLLHEVLSDLDLSQKKRFKNTIAQARSEAETSLASEGHAYAATRARSGLHPYYQLQEMTSGIEQFHFLQKLLELIDNDWEKVQTDLQKIKEFLNNRSRFFVNITVDKDLVSLITNHISTFLRKFTPGEIKQETTLFEKSNINQALIIPSTINYVAQAYKAPLLQPHGSLNAVSKIVNRSYLWTRVRAQGGAYGCFFRADTKTNVVLFASYRDPNTWQTLTAYNELAEYLRTNTPTSEEIEGAILAASGELDADLSSYEQGYVAMEWYLSGITETYRQKRREELLATTESDLRNFANYIATVENFEKSITILGNKEKLEATLQKFPDLFEIKPLL